LPTSSSSACSACSPKTRQLLPAGIFTDLLKNAGSDTGKATRRIAKLFTAMQKKGGDYGDHDIAWFNGGLFKNIEIPGR
jgi:hypothetical protein